MSGDSCRVGIQCGVVEWGAVSFLSMLSGALVPRGFDCRLMGGCNASGLGVLDVLAYASHTDQHNTHKAAQGAQGAQEPCSTGRGCSLCWSFACHLFEPPSRGPPPTSRSSPADPARENQSPKPPLPLPLPCVDARASALSPVPMFLRTHAPREPRLRSTSTRALSSALTRFGREPNKHKQGRPEDPLLAGPGSRSGGRSCGRRYGEQTKQRSSRGRQRTWWWCHDMRGQKECTICLLPTRAF